MGKLINWLKSNKLTVVLIIAVGYLLWQQNYPGPIRPLSLNQQRFGGEMMTGAVLPKTGGGAANMMRSILPPDSEAPPTSGQDRLIIRETTLSMVVKDASKSLKTIQQKTESLGGYMVNSHLSKPEESANGTITVRVPEEKLTEALEAFRRAGLRVVDENVSGRDITDQYVDLEARLATLNKTKAKFEEILDKATQVQDLLNVQRELINLQSQIDSIKGQQQYLSQSAKLSKITVYLSTDEFSLPYSPADPWRPNVVFKLAVRSLVTNLRNIGSAIIWIGVYSPVWVPISLIAWFLTKKNKIKA
ncbi:DUF4349 domain-containing protein [Candidatus Collierbacteria bacterium]|nr:DUF4349 domain-containing protein [Candidatus Collierbacteria bacterium]